MPVSGINFDFTYTDNTLFEDATIEFQTSYLDTSQEVEGDFILYPPGSRGLFRRIGAPLFGPFPDGVIGNPEIYENHFRLGLRVDYLGFDKHKLTVGTGYYHGEIDRVTEEKNFGQLDTLLPILPGDPLVDVSDTPLVFLTEDQREITISTSRMSGCWIMIGS